MKFYVRIMMIMHLGFLFIGNLYAAETKSKDAIEKMYTSILKELWKLKLNQMVDATTLKDLLNNASDEVFTLEYSTSDQNPKKTLLDHLLLFDLPAKFAQMEKLFIEKVKNFSDEQMKSVIWRHFTKSDAQDVSVLWLVEKFGFLEVVECLLRKMNLDHVNASRLQEKLLSQDIRNYSIEESVRGVIFTLWSLTTNILLLNEDRLIGGLRLLKFFIAQLDSQKTITINYQKYLNLEFLLNAQWWANQKLEPCNILMFFFPLIDQKDFFQNELNFGLMCKFLILLKEYGVDFNKPYSLSANLGWLLYRICNHDIACFTKCIDFAVDKLGLDLNYILLNEGEHDSRTLLVEIMADYKGVTAHTYDQNILEQYIEYLLDKDADPNIELIRGHTLSLTSTSLTYASYIPFLMIFKYCSLNFIEKILKKACLINFDFNKKIIVPLSATKNFEVSFLGFFLNPTSINFYETAESKKEKIKFLVKHGADINYLSNEQTSVMHAVSQFNEDLLTFLLQQGASVSKTAENHENVEIVLERMKNNLKPFETMPLNKKMCDTLEFNYDKCKDPVARKEAFGKICKIIESAQESEQVKKYQAQRVQEQKQRADNLAIAAQINEEVRTRTELTNKEAKSRKGLVENFNEIRNLAALKQYEQDKKVIELKEAKNYMLHEGPSREEIEDQEQNQFENLQATEIKKIDQLKKAQDLQNKDRLVVTPKAVIVTVPKAKSAEELLNEKSIERMSPTELNIIKKHVNHINENLRQEIDLNLKAKYGFRKTLFNKKNVSIDLDHIFSLKVEMKNNEISFNGGHLYDSCNKLQALSIVHALKTQELPLPDTCVKFIFYPTVLNAAPVIKTTFPKDWNISNICSAIVNAQFEREEKDSEGLDIVYAKTNTIPQISMKMVFAPATANSPIKLITVIPMDSMNDSVALPALPKQAKSAKSAAQAIPVPMPYGAKNPFA